MSRPTAISPSRSVAAAHPTSPWQGLARKATFHETAATKGILAKATDFVRAGVTINLSGAAGLGKTTLALRIAEEIGRPISFMTGHQWLTTRDFVGREVGQTERTTIDRYVQSVRRTETESRSDWKAAILALSMQRGYTLVYDEFTRASAEANSALLSVLEEGILVATDRASDRSYISAHEDFRIILTSNPHEYAGVHGAPDALMDRVMTITLDAPDAAQLGGIVSARTGLDKTTARQIADTVAAAHKGTSEGDASMMRSAVMIGQVVAHKIRNGRTTSNQISDIAKEILAGRGLQVTKSTLKAFYPDPKPETAA
ncbi:MAG: AAA family ATPase [Pseudomonadota bacterium]